VLEVVVVVTSQDQVDQQRVAQAVVAMVVKTVQA
jgi:hypothetical protein